MILKTSMVAFFLAGCITGSVFAGVPEYMVMRTKGEIVIDGVLEEEDWSLAKPVGEFGFPWWTDGEKEQAEAKILWNDDFLYVAFTCEDSHIWADHYDTNSATYKDDCVEIFWNPNPEAGDMYNMFEMNCIGNLLSVYNNFERSFGDRDCRIMVPRIGRTVSGTVNNDSDNDTSWVIEVAIRFSDYPELSKRTAPVSGDMWRVGLNRCGGKTNPQFSQWSPSQTDRPNFHVPDDFGRIVFSDLPAGTVNVGGRNNISLPEEVILHGSFPNPFNATTTIRFTLLSESFVKLNIYSITDQKIRGLVSERLAAGVYSFVWDGLDDDGNPVSSGVYLSHLRAGERMVSGRMTLLK